MIAQLPIAYLESYVLQSLKFKLVTRKLRDLIITYRITLLTMIIIIGMCQSYKKKIWKSVIKIFNDCEAIIWFTFSVQKLPVCLRLVIIFWVKYELNTLFYITVALYLKYKVWKNLHVCSGLGLINNEIHVHTPLITRHFNITLFAFFSTGK